VLDFQWLWFDLKMIFRFLDMMKTLQGGLGEILRKFRITISKSTQNLWNVSKPQN